MAEFEKFIAGDGLPALRMVPDLDLDAIATRHLDNVPPTANPANWVVMLSQAERDALVAVARWAQSAHHHLGCRWQPDISWSCTCGRDDALAPFKEADR